MGHYLSTVNAPLAHGRRGKITVELAVIPIFENEALIGMNALKWLRTLAMWRRRRPTPTTQSRFSSTVETFDAVFPAELELPSGSHFVRKRYANVRIVTLLHKLFDPD